MGDNQFGSDDAGIFMKQESVFDPTPMTPTQNKSLLGVQLSPDSPNEHQSLHMKRNLSYGNLGNTTEARVLVLYTGGTIGMLRNDKNGKFKQSQIIMSCDSIAVNNFIYSPDGRHDLLIV
jgi:L-asparaginase/Glu-tRNA(Gln) amidotransferase subunit D